MQGFVRTLSMAALAGAALLALTGCAHPGPGTGQAADAAACRQETPDVFALEGEITAALATCVAATFQPSTREVILNSMGGDVASALDIAAHFEGRRLTMRVRNACNSSCANYFLPLARRIVVEPGGLIILHGSVDPWTVERAILSAQDGPDPGGPSMRDGAGFERLRALAARQADFAARNSIPPGWLLYREAGSDGRDIAGLSDDLRPRGRHLLVEEALLRSCLTGADIQPYQDDLQRRWLRSYRRIGLYLSRIEPSGAAVCVPASEGSTGRASGPGGSDPAA